MGKLLRRLVPLAAVLAWRNRDQLADWYRKRNESDHDTKAEVPKTVPQTQIAPIPAGDTTHHSTLVSPAPVDNT